MADSTLAAIQKKVRRLTRAPSEQQLSSAEINEYINTFVLYDMPAHLRLFPLRKTFSFYTNPGQDRYPTDIDSFVGVTTNPLYNFQNRYETTHNPVYIAGYESLWSQSREEFYRYYPLTNSIQTVATGNGISNGFTGSIPNVNGSGSVLLQNNVVFSSIDVNGQGLTLIDVPVHSTLTGNPGTEGNLYVPGFEPSTPPTVVDVSNTIDYITGAFTISFPLAPASGEEITSQVVVQTTSRPNTLLYFDNTFFLRPVPDKPYKIDIEVNALPTELLQTSDEPNLQQWWQYIAYGAAKKIFEDRSSMEDVATIMPEFKVQERLVLRTTIVQRTKERTATIYTEQTGLQAGYGWGWNNNG